MNNLGFVFASPEAKAHWTTDRLWKRVGLNPKEFPHQFVCGPNLLQEIARSNVRAVILFGEFPLQFVLGKTELLRWFHRVVPLKLESRTVHCVPCLSPDQLLPYKAIEDDDDRKGMRHPPRFTGMVVSCIKLALKVAEEGHVVSPVDYLEDPHPARFKQWVDGFYAHVAQHPDTILSSDIETAYKLKEQDESELEERPRVKDGDVLRISFAYLENKAVSIPWHSEYKQDIQRLLAYKGMHCGWNCVAFDGPILESNDTPIGGFLLDGMDGWHLLQTDLDKGLEFVTSVYTDLAPWKHLSDSQPALYSCIDSDAALRCVNGIVRDLKARGLYERFLKEMTLMQVLKRAGETGNQINEQHRLELKVKLEGLLYTKLLEAQDLVADKFKRRKLYKRVPKSWPPERVGECTLVITATGCNKCGKIGGVSVKHKCPIDPEWQKIKVQTEHTHYYDLTPFAGVEDLPSLLEALKSAGFNPSSPHQMKAYMRTHKHPLGKNWKTDKDSADVKHVKKLVAKYGKAHPIYAKTLEIRQIQKTLSTYINGLAPDEQGLVHCTYVNSPSTWRLGCRNFNAQNLGKRNTNQYAKEARQIIIPRSGNVLLTADSSSIEAVMVGRFMGSTQYEQLAKRGIHSYVTCKWLNLEFTPENVDLIKSQHVALYDTFKTINHGCLTGDHEVLTPSGWVRFDEYDFKTPIMEWGVDGKMDFRVPLNHVKAPWKGEMVTLQGAAIDAIVTPDHAFPVRSYDSVYKREYIVKRAASELPEFGRIPVYGHLEGTIMDDAKRLQLMVAVQADGHITKGQQVVFNFHKQRKVNRLKDLLGDRQYAYTQTKDGHNFYVPREAIADVLSLLDEGKTFRLPYLLSLDHSLRELIVEELTYWDGCRYGYGRVYVSCNRSNIDTMQTVAFSVGKQGLVREKPPTGFRKSTMWELRLNNRKYIRLEQLERGTKPHDDLVYCITSSTGYFVTRHNGTVYTTSNTNFGMGPYMMYMNEPDKFPTLQAAKKFQSFLFEQLPGLQEWHHELRITAKKQGYLDSPWGIRHYFYDVFTYQYDDDRSLVLDENGNAKVKLGKDANKVIAFKPQNSGGMFMRDNLLLLAQSEVGRYMPAVVSIHDGYTLDIPEKLVPLGERILTDILTRPIVEMGGLRVGCEIEIGRKNFGKMEKLRKVEV